VRKRIVKFGPLIWVDNLGRKSVGGGKCGSQLGQMVASSLSPPYLPDWTEKWDQNHGHDREKPLGYRVKVFILC
jgi:hypothetical protein